CSSSPGRPTPPLASPSPISHEETEEGNPPSRPSLAHGAPLSSLNLSHLQDVERTAHDKGTAEEAAPMIPNDIQGCSPTTQRVLPSSLIISPGHRHLFALRIKVCEQQQECFLRKTTLKFPWRRPLILLHMKGTAEEAAPMIPDDIQGCSPTTQRVLPSSLISSPGHRHLFVLRINVCELQQECFLRKTN
ncbi:hypothetical protein U9M48_013097, partial [Paspalum notatum var. saurae]